MSSPLPQEIGRTEQMLSALLLEHVLAGRAFRTNDEWVAVNVLQRNQPLSLDSWGLCLTEALSASPERVASILSDLIEKRCVLEMTQGMILSVDAERDLNEARRMTAHVSAEIDRQIPVEDRAATERSLRLVRRVVSDMRDRGFPSVP